MRLKRDFSSQNFSLQIASYKSSKTTTSKASYLFLQYHIKICLFSVMKIVKLSLNFYYDQHFSRFKQERDVQNKNDRQSWLRANKCQVNSLSKCSICFSVSLFQWYRIFLSYKNKIEKSTLVIFPLTKFLRKVLLISCFKRANLERHYPLHYNSVSKSYLPQH